MFLGGVFVYGAKNWVKKDNSANQQIQDQLINSTPIVKGTSTDAEIENQEDKQNIAEPNQPVNQQPINQSIDQQINQIPILMYHYIRDYNDPNDQIGTNLSVSPAKFDAQLQWLKDHGYQTVDFDYLLTPYPLPLKPVILSFDDGYLDAYTNAYPILKKYRFTATFYIITSFVGKDNYMNWDQILELKNAGMNIGSHSITHPDLSKASEEKIEREISQSQKTLEEKIGVSITDFCYPAGKYDNRTIEMLKKYHYKAATTTKSGVYQTVEDKTDKNNLYELPRLRITNQTDLSKILK